MVSFYFITAKKLNYMTEAMIQAFATMRNVAGEIYGAIAAMEYAINHNIKYLSIYYDYMGIAKWCTGEWNATKEGTIAYKKFYNKAKKHVNITFCKVKGHSGDKYNDMADALAKRPAVCNNLFGIHSNYLLESQKVC